MILQYATFEKAVAQLKKSLDFLHSEMARKDPGLREQFRAAVIQAFEYTYELAYKMVRRQLKQIVPNPAELDEMAYMDLMRTAAKAGLVREATPFKAYREMRNITSRTYDSDKAEEIIAVMDAFLKDMNFLLEELKQRNHEADWASLKDDFRKIIQKDFVRISNDL